VDCRHDENSSRLAQIDRLEQLLGELAEKGERDLAAIERDDARGIGL
jgi:hypothetical protein